MVSYLVGNETSLSRKPRIPDEIKSYNGTLSGSDGRSFRIRQENSHEEPLAEKSR